MFIPTFTFFDTFETLEKGKKDALQMYKPEHPGHAEAKAHTDWAYTKLPNENWALWTTRHHRTNPQDFTPEVKQEIEHFAGSQHIPEVANVRFDKTVDLPTGLKTLKDAEKAGQRRIKASLRLAPKPRKAKKIMAFEDGYSWWNLGQGSCEKEGSAMGHCGNVPSEVEGDEIWSLRKEHNIGGKKYYEPHLTFIHNQGFLGEMKGRNNEKPTKQYHSKIHALLDQTGAIPFGGGYAPQNNFDIKDLDPEKAAKLFEKHPRMKVLLDPEYVVGMQDIEGAPDKTLNLIASRSKMSPDAERHLIEQLGQKKTRDPFGTLTTNPNLSSEGVDKILFHEAKRYGIYEGINIKRIYNYNKNLSIEQQEKALTDYTFLNYNPNIHPSIAIKALESGYNEVLSNKNLPKEALDHWFNTPKLKNDPYLVHALSHPKLDRQQMESVVKEPSTELEGDYLTAVAKNENLPDDLAFKVIDMANGPEPVKALFNRANVSEAVASKIIDSVPDGFKEANLNEDNYKNIFRMKGLERLAARPDLSDKNIRRIFDKKVIPLSNISNYNITPETLTHIVKNSPANGTESHFSDAEKALNIFYASDKLTPESALILVNNNQDSSNLNNLRHKLKTIASNEQAMNHDLAVALMKNKAFNHRDIGLALQENPNTPADIKKELRSGDPEHKAFFDKYGDDPLLRSEHAKVASVAAFKDGLILFGKRNDNGKWALAGGHIEEGESPTEGVIRELWEETGLVPNGLEYLGSGVVSKANVIVYAFRCNVSGEATNENDPDEEFETYRWVNPDDLPEEIINNLHSPKNIVLEKLGLQDPDLNKASDKQKVGRVIRDWQRHVKPFEDVEYWSKRFAPHEEIFARNKPKGTIQLWRSERTDIDNQYDKRHTSWSTNPNDINNFGWGTRRMVTGYFKPEHILASLPHLGLDTEGLGEVIVRPGNHQVIPWKLSFDRQGAFNIHEEPERAKASGLHSPKNIVLEKLGLQEPDLNKASDKSLEKMSIKDISDGMDLGVSGPDRVFDYSHLLGSKNYKLKMYDRQNGNLKLVLENDGNRVGSLEGSTRNDSVRPEYATLDPKHRNMGIGTKMYEALIAHAHRKYGATHIEGSVHSTSASLVHRKLSNAHGMEYSSKERSTKPNVSGSPVGFVGDFDERFGPYRYTIKSEPMEKGLGAMVLAGIIGAGLHGPAKPMPTKYSDLMGNRMSYENLHEDLIPIAQLESSGGKFTNHAKNSAGEFHTAFGPLGFKISTAHEQWRKHPELQKQFPNLKDPAVFMAAIKKNPAMYNAIASSHFNTLKQKHGSAEKAAAAWRHGSGAVFKMKPEQIESDPYIVKYKQLKKTEAENWLMAGAELETGGMLAWHEDLDKGAMSRLFPYNPSIDNMKGKRPFNESTGRVKLANWQMNADPKDRAKVPQMRGNIMARALHGLHRVTQVRVNPAGEREFLLHRAMGKDEHKKFSDGTNFSPDDNKSWSPIKSFGQTYAPHIISAWIPEKNILSIPKQLGTLKYREPGKGIYNKINGKYDKGGSNEFAPEHEVITSPGSFAIHETATRDLDKE